MSARAVSTDACAGVTVVTVRCEECGRAPEVEDSAAGWVAFRVDLPDDPDPAEVTAYCPECSAKEFGRVDAGLPIGVVDSQRLAGQ